MSTVDARPKPAKKVDADPSTPFWQTLQVHPEFRGLTPDKALARLSTVLSARGPPSYTVISFCESYNISRSALYKLWRAGRGPEVTRNGTKILISAEAADRWWRTKNKNIGKEGKWVKWTRTKKPDDRGKSMSRSRFRGRGKEEAGAA